MKLVILLVSLVTPLQTATTLKPGVPTDADIAMAVSRVPRIRAERFAALPPTVREAFNQMNCQVPQRNLTSGPHNVVQGEFAARGQRDWAALCSDGTTSVIRVVWGGPERCSDGVGPRQDVDMMIVNSPSNIGFGREIGVASIEQVNRSIVRYGKSLPEPPNHDGVADGGEKGGMLYYCQAGTWLTLPG